MRGNIFGLLVLVGVINLARADVKLDIILSARNLPNMDIFGGSPDAYVKLFYAESNTANYNETGETVNHSDNNNPDWSEVFHFTVVGTGSSSQQRLKLEIWDADSPDGDDYIGVVEIYLSEVINSFGNKIEKTITSAESGVLIIQGRVNGSFSTGVKGDDRFSHPSNVLTVPAHFTEKIK